MPEPFDPAGHRLEPSRYFEDCARGIVLHPLPPSVADAKR
jgi:hypothetical protein